ncbi:MAG: phosphatase PAP2 family protein [Lutisporaceae bacterium]
MSEQKNVKRYNNINRHIRMFYGELCVFITFTAIAAFMIWHYYGYGSWALDNNLDNFMSSIRNPLLDIIFRVITYTGEGISVGIIMTVMVVLFLYFKKSKEATLITIYMLGVWSLNEILKDLIARPRPDISFHLVKAIGFSMPSGHSMNFMAFMLLSLYFLWIHSRNKNMNINLTIIMLTYAILVGLSRVYLHVHYISDVITGWSIGASCAVIAVVIHRVWSKNKMDDKPERQYKP